MVTGMGYSEGSARSVVRTVPDELRRSSPEDVGVACPGCWSCVLLRGEGNTQYVIRKFVVLTHVLVGIRECKHSL